MRVGLTGGIGSGKSAVSQRLGTHGAVVIDYDVLAREVVQPGEAALAEIAERFGTSVVDADGALDRPALGAIVFADPQALRDLEAITHPAIRARAAERETHADDAAVVVHDNPLLIEMGSAESCDVVVVVDVPEAVQIERLVTQRGMTDADARARIAVQASRQDRLAMADHIIDNSGSLDDLDAAVDELWSELSARNL